MVGQRAGGTLRGACGPHRHRTEMPTAATIMDQQATERNKMLLRPVMLTTPRWMASKRKSIQLSGILSEMSGPRISDHAMAVCCVALDELAAESNQPEGEALRPSAC
mmetsp:Transcript_8822/g.21000  ORF Transcript_8822/g.21000 Transcript_8822/m.21000 type:complete len:107 (-) Transcript_8822:12-332(-)